MKLIEILEFCPRIIFSKLTPENINNFNYDKDFTYYYFNNSMYLLSGYSPRELCNGNHNAKIDFPIDYLKYFKDDIEIMVMNDISNPKIIIDPWKTYNRDNVFVYTIKN